MRAGYAMILFVFMSLGLVGCGTSSGCSDNADCQDMEVCVRTNPSRPGVCADVECVTNEHCDLGAYCSSAPDYVCTPGCNADDDCRAGQTCNVSTNSCQAYGCRDTELDCAYGEFCTNGSCVADTAPHCDGSCDPFTPNSCGAGNACAAWNLHGSCNLSNNDSDCGNNQYCGAFEIDESSSCDSLFNTGCPTGWNCGYFDLNNDGIGDSEVCYEGSCFDTRCLVGCANQTECPRGYQCADIGLGGQHCTADCDYMAQWQ